MEINCLERKFPLNMIRYLLPVGSAQSPTTARSSCAKEEDGRTAVVVRGPGARESLRRLFALRVSQAIAWLAYAAVREIGNGINMHDLPRPDSIPNP